MEPEERGPSASLVRENMISFKHSTLQQIEKGAAAEFYQAYVNANGFGQLPENM